MMRKLANLLVLAAMAAVLGAGAPARADLSLTFDAAGTFDDGYKLSGTVTIDVTSGVATVVDLTVSSPTGSFLFQSINFQASQVSDYAIQAVNSQSNAYLDIFTTVSSLVNYSGGPLSTGATGAQLGDLTTMQDYDMTSGSLTAEATAVPEPSTLFPVLSVVALLGLRHAWRRRRAAT
jgi:hypothetical protein